MYNEVNCWVIHEFIVLTSPAKILRGIIVNYCVAHIVKVRGQLLIGPTSRKIKIRLMIIIETNSPTCYRIS